jgi:hypothetical protein
MGAAERRQRHPTLLGSMVIQRPGRTRSLLLRSENKRAIQNLLQLQLDRPDTGASIMLGYSRYLLFRSTQYLYIISKG